MVDRKTSARTNLRAASRLARVSGNSMRHPCRSLNPPTATNSKPILAFMTASRHEPSG
jgi:hypothetical protein